MLNDTLIKFGYPKTLIKEYKNWMILCQPKQVTLSSLILICKDEVDAFSKISEESFSELPKIIKEIENKIKNLFNNDKINYLMLMMVDSEVHFHIIPRYSTDKEFEGFIFKDKSWPKKPYTGIVNEISEIVLNKLIEKLRIIFEDKIK